jgi:hypothetical protein
VRSSPNDETSAKRNEVGDRELGTKTPVINDASPEIAPRVKTSVSLFFLLVLLVLLVIQSQFVIYVI